VRFETWRLLSDPPQSPPWNMAVDEAMATAFAEGAVPPTIRFYRWATPAFSIGRFQILPDTFSDFLGSFPPVRRITGGRGILHNPQDQEITYAIVAGTGSPPFSGGIRETFCTISEGLIAGLKTLGVDAERHIQRPLSSDSQKLLCFSSTSRYEITARGKKLCGSAQKRWTDRFLQQGSLARFRAPHHPDDQITLDELVAPRPTHETLEAALAQGLAARLGIRLEPGVLTSKEKQLAHGLVAEKYSNDAWNLHRSWSVIPT
jgi:lipoate-protein ligase A